MSDIKISVKVIGLIGGCPVMCIGAKVTIDGGTTVHHTGSHGEAHFSAPAGAHTVTATFFQAGSAREIHVTGSHTAFDLPLELDGVFFETSADGNPPWTPVTPDLELPQSRSSVLKIRWEPGYRGMRAYLAAGNPNDSAAALRAAAAAKLPSALAQQLQVAPSGQSNLPIFAAVGDGNTAPDFEPGDETVTADVSPDPALASSSVNVSMRRTSSRLTDDVPLWVSIRKSTDALSFARYSDFMEWIFCGGTNPDKIKGDFSQIARRALPFTDTDSYRNIKFATEAFVMANCGVNAAFKPDDALYLQEQVSIDLSGQTLASLFAAYRDDPQAPNVLPYLALIRRKLKDEQIKDIDIGEIGITASGTWQPHAATCYGLLRRKLENPCFLELIWSYWQEEGMLNQTMNAISRRFQNARGPLPNDPLANTEIDPLRPLNNVLWGYVQDEQNRLSVVRRNYEYDHHYGLRLAGKAVNNIRTADSRSRFLEAFHTLLSTVSAFYKRDDDTTIVADGFPVLNALKEAHLILSQGAHGQFGDLPSTARIEMLMQQWILARPEFREFLPTRIMVAYPEPWMDRVDAMKKLQNWSDTSVLHFRNLAIFGEQILLAVRYGAWAAVNDPWQAVNWARYWRPEVQGYLHAYRSVTGVDLSVDVTNARIDSVLPSVHLVKRLSEQKIRTA